MIQKQLAYLIFCFIFSVLFLIIRFVLKFDGLYGQDAYEYLRYTNEMYSFFSKGTILGDYFWGLGYPFFGCLFKFFVGDTSLSLQLVSMISGLLSCIFIYKIIELIYSEQPKVLLIFSFFAISPIVITHSFLVMSDMLAVAFICSAIFYFINFLIHSKSNHFIIGVFLAVLAFHTRYASLMTLVILLIVVLIKIIKEKRYSLILVSIILFLVISLPHFLIRSNGSLNFLSHQLLTGWNILNLFRQNFLTEDGVSNHKVINLIFCFYSFFHPQFFNFGLIALIIGLIYKFKFLVNNRFQNILLSSIVFYALFVGGIPFQHKRLLLTTMPHLIIVFYPFLNRILHIKRIRFYSLTFVLVVQVLFIFYYGKVYYDRNKLEQLISNDLKVYSDETVYIFEMDLALKARDIKLDYQNIWYKEYSDFKNGALVLVNAANLEKQWVGKNPFINWNKLKSKCKLKELKTYSNGWSLYQIHQNN